MNKFYAAFLVDLEFAKLVALADSWDEAKTFVLRDTAEELTHWTQIEYYDEAKCHFVCAVNSSDSGLFTHYLIVECTVNQVANFALTLLSSGWDFNNDNLIPIGDR